MDYQDFKKQIDQLEAEFRQIYKSLEIANSQKELQAYKQQMSEVDFWQKDQATAQIISKKYSLLLLKLNPWLEFEANFDQLKTKLAVFKQMADETFTDELKQSLEKCQQQFLNLKDQLKFKDKYDDCEVVISISAGAGGVDAQDWTAMLLRMYSRWATKSKVDLELISQSADKEAGLKSVSFSLKNKLFLYGLLKGEHGVHRLVRLSPFNAQNLRQTSFAQVEVLPILEDESEVSLTDNDLKIDVFKSSGPGGQSVNTTDSAVRITHLPTNLVVSIQNSRSQFKNKQLALTILKAKLAKLQLEQRLQKLDDLKKDKLPNQWGSQIRSYVMHPYKQVKDLRTQHIQTNIEAVLDGQIDDFLEEYLNYRIHEKQ